MEAPSEQLYTLKKYAENNQALQGHRDSVTCIAVLPNGNVISGSKDNTLKVWDIHIGQCVNTLQGHTALVSCVAVLPNGNVISGSYDKTLRVWDINTGQCLNTLKHNNVVKCVAVLPNGNVISGFRDWNIIARYTLKVWDINTGQCLNTLEGHTAEVTCAAVLPNGNVISGSRDMTLRVWDINIAQCVTTLQVHAFVPNLIVLPQGNVITVPGMSATNTLKVWDIHTGQCVKCVNTLQGYDNTVFSVAVLPNGNVVGGSQDCTIKVWDIHTSQCVNTLEGHLGVVSCVAVLPNGNVVSGSRDNTLKVWIDNRLQNEYHIRKAARILAQGYRDRNCLFSTLGLPSDVGHKIAGLTRDSTIHSDEQASEIAKRYFCKPQCDEIEDKKRKREGSEHENEKDVKKF